MSFVLSSGDEEYKIMCTFSPVEGVLFVFFAADAVVGVG